MADIKESPDTYHIGFLLGPRINAGGRIGQSDLGANLLTTQDPKKSYEIATTLDSLNKKRKLIEEDILNEAYLLAEKEIDDLPWKRRLKRIFRLEFSRKEWQSNTKNNQI